MPPNKGKDWRRKSGFKSQRERVLIFSKINTGMLSTAEERAKARHQFCVADSANNLFGNKSQKHPSGWNPCTTVYNLTKTLMAWKDANS